LIEDPEPILPETTFIIVEQPKVIEEIIFEEEIIVPEKEFDETAP